MAAVVTPAWRRLAAIRSALYAAGAAGENEADATTLLEVAGEIAQTAGLSLSDEGDEWGQVYREIGVTPVINATGSVTILGGSTPHPEVSLAMDQANSAFVPLWELQKVAGAGIAKMVGVSSGESPARAFTPQGLLRNLPLPATSSPFLSGCYRDTPPSPISVALQMCVVLF